MARNYQDYIARGKQQYGEKFDESKLAPHFIPYYNSQRIEVTTTYESGATFVRRGTVGATTGWVPAFLLMGRVTDHGSFDVLGVNDKVTAIIGSHSRRYSLRTDLPLDSKRNQHTAA